MSGLRCPICGKDDGVQMYGVVICKTALAKANAENEHLQSALRERNEARAEVERLKQELATAKRRADEWEYRSGEWMVCAEDVEGQLTVALEELAKARKDVELERSRRDFLIRAIESAASGEGADAEWLREVAKSARRTHDVAAGPTR